MKYFSGAVTRFIIFISLFIFFNNVNAQEAQQAPVKIVTIRTVPDSVVKNLKNSKEFLYANDPSYWPKQQKRDNTALARFLMLLGKSGIIKWVLIILLTSIVVFVLYQVLSVNGFNLFTARKKKLKVPDILLIDTDQDIDQLIAESIQHQNFRSATRYLYIKTLQMLSAGNQIKLQAKATNHDYILQMANSPVSKEFRMLTNLYEYVWYGEFKPGNEQFNIINKQFTSFISQI